MDVLSSIASGSRIVGWVLVHFIWQAGLIGLFYAAARTCLPRGEARYRLGLLALVVLSVCPLLTLWHLLQTATPILPQATGIPWTNVATSALGQPTSDSPLMPDAVLNALLPWLVLAWLGGVSALSMRAWRQWRKIRLLVDTATAIRSWQARVDAMARHFGLTRRISVLCSAMVSTPVLVGWIRPVILLPIAVACDFPVAQIELILAHELAHIRRWDPLANLFQVVLETLHFYHPVVHWISRDVRNEREICCDRMALALSGGSRHVLASALAGLGDLREQHSSLALAANGGVLLDRVQQLMLPRDGAIASPARFAGALLAAGLLLVTVRLELSDVRLQQNLTATLNQWNAGLSLARWAAPHVTASMELHNLVPQRLDALPPPASPAQLVAASLTDAAPRLPVAVQALDRIAAPSLSPLRIGDLSHTGRGLPLRIATPAAAPVLSGSPLPVHIRRPAYPQEALVQGIEGQVTIEFGVDTDGSVHDLKVVAASPSGTFDQAGIQAMRGWKYAASAEPSTQRYRQTLAFTLNGARRGTGATAGQVIEAEVGCQVSIGSNICRTPENAPARGRADGNAAAGQP